MRKVLVVLGIVGVCLAIALLALWAFLDVNRYRPQIEANLEAKFGRPVKLGEMSVSILPLAFRVRDATVAEDPAFGVLSFAMIDTLYVQPRLFPLLRGTVEVKSLQLTHPKLEVIRNKNGEWNFAKLLAGRPLSLRELRLENGQVAITDLFEKEPRAVYDHIDLVAHDYVPDRAFSVEASIHLPGASDQVISFNGKAGPIRRESLAQTPVDGKVELQDVALSGLQRFAKTNALVNSEAIVTAKAEVRNDGVIASRGHVEFRDATIHGVQLGFPITADYDISSDKGSNTIAFRDTSLKLNKTAIAVEGSVNSQATPMTIDLHARTNGSSISEIARLAAALGVAFNKSSDVSGDLSLDVRAKGAIDKPVLDGVATARNLRIHGGNVREPVDVNSVGVTFSPTAIRSNPFTARTGRTSVSAEVSIENYSTSTPQLHAGIQTGDAELGELLAIARAYGFSIEDGLTASGSTAVNVTVDGPLDQPSGWAYTGTGTLNNAMMHVPSLGSKPLAVRRANLRFSANSLMVDDLTFSIGGTTASGNLAAHNLAAPRVEFSLSADKINAAEWHEMMKAETPPAAASKQTVPRKSLLARATGSGQLAAQTVVYDQLVLSNVRSTVRLDEGVITMSPITAGVYSGQEVGTVVIDSRGQPVVYKVNSKLQGVDANQLLSSVSSVKETLYGVMSASTNGRFTAEGGGNIARSLNGDVSLNLAEGRLAHMDLLHQLASIGKFVRTARAVEPFTKVLRLSGDFAITNGVARTNNLELVLDDGTVAADGSVDLVDQKLNLRLSAVLSQDYSQTVGGTNVAGLMSTVLANRNGELVIPIVVTGTLKNPQFAPDVEKIARMKLQNLLPTFSDPDRLSTTILGQVLGNKPSQEPKPENPLRDIFEGLFGKGQRQ